MYLTVLVDNFCSKNGLLAEYGFSIHLKCDNNKEVLMDTGQGKVIHSNAQKLGINLQNIDHLVLSHGHFDHVWGVPSLLEKIGNIPVWAHPKFDKARYRKFPNERYYIGSYVKKEDVNFNPIINVTEITSNVWGIEIPLEKRTPEYVPSTNHLKILENDNWKLDTFPDDISLVVKGEYGYSIILGCAHSGVINILNEISEVFSTKEFYSVIGGMHMGKQSQQYCDKVVDKLVNNYKVKLWRPSHCTGFNAASMLASKADNVNWGGAGTTLKL